MKKSLIKQMGVTYTEMGDYVLPILVLPAEDERKIGAWGRGSCSI